MTFSELDAAVSRLASALGGQGFRQGDVVAVSLGNSVEYVLTIFALARAGLVAAHIPAQYTSGEADVLFSTARASGAIIDGRSLERTFVDALPADRLVVTGGDESPTQGVPFERLLMEAGDETARLPTVRPSDLFMVGFTSGTTGRPKGVLISQSARALGAVTSAFLYGFRPAERHLAAAPLHHGAPLDFALMAIASGGSLFPMSGFEAERCRARIESAQIHNMFVVPTILNRLLDTDRSTCEVQLRSVRTIVSNAAPLSMELKEKCGQVAPWINLWEAYGSTEAGWMTALSPSDLLEERDSCGQPLPLVDIQVTGPDGVAVDDGQPGEVWVRSPFVFERYAHESTARDADAWHRTGDLATQSASGHLRLLGREDDLIITGGVNVHPQEIEDVTRRHPSVEDVAVIPYPDPDKGAVPMAVIVTDGSDVVELEDELRTLWLGSLVAYKHPRRVVVVSDLPRTSTGKVRRKALRERMPDRPSSRRPDQAQDGNTP